MEGLVSVGALILGIIIWLIFNSLVTRWYFGSSCSSIIISILGEIFVCVIIAGGILSLIGKFLGGVLGFVGGILLFLAKAVLIIIVVGIIIGIVYFTYGKIKGNNVDLGNITDKVKSFAKQNDNAEVEEAGDKSERESIGFCTNCGSPIEYGCQFCASCGTPVLQSMIDEAERVRREKEEKVRMAEEETRKESEKKGRIENVQSEATVHSQIEKERALFCQQCGAKLDPDSRFCASCGSKID